MRPPDRPAGLGRRAGGWGRGAHRRRLGREVPPRRPSRCSQRSGDKSVTKRSRFCYVLWNRAKTYLWPSTRCVGTGFIHMSSFRLVITAFGARPWTYSCSLVAADELSVMAMAVHRVAVHQKTPQNRPTPCPRPHRTNNVGARHAFFVGPICWRACKKGYMSHEELNRPSQDKDPLLPGQPLNALSRRLQRRQYQRSASVWADKNVCEGHTLSVATTFSVTCHNSTVQLQGESRTSRFYLVNGHRPGTETCQSSHRPPVQGRLQSIFSQHFISWPLVYAGCR